MTIPLIRTLVRGTFDVGLLRNSRSLAITCLFSKTGDPYESSLFDGWILSGFSFNTLSLSIKVSVFLVHLATSHDIARSLCKSFPWDSFTYHFGGIIKQLASAKNWEGCWKLITVNGWMIQKLLGHKSVVQNWSWNILATFYTCNYS